jgi:KipI family sensor histidine kinase inhibitor
MAGSFVGPEKWPFLGRLASFMLAGNVQEAMRIIPASDSSLLVVFGDTISPALNQRVIALFRAIQSRHDPRIRNLHPAYASLLIDFDPLRMTHDELTAVVQELANTDDVAAEKTAEVVTVPVCYDVEFGPDLPDVARHAGVSAEEVIRLHSSPTYLVYFLGFSPGFVYLGGLPEILHTPRLATPRPSIAGGSVGIAGSQTGIYPVDSPGGWRLIGRTPLRMFDPETTPPTRLQPGDRMKFEPIDRERFEEFQVSSFE